MNGHNEHGAGSRAVVGIERSRWCAGIVAEEQVCGADEPDLPADY
jgi:hypothetical protein